MKKLALLIPIPAFLLFFACAENKNKQLVPAQQSYGQGWEAVPPGETAPADMGPAPNLNVTPIR